MTSFLILYASKHGHTAKITQRIADRLEAAGAEVFRHPVDGADLLELDTYDGVIIAGSIHAGHHQHGLVDWVRHHAIRLSRVPSAFVSVSLTAAEDTDKARETAQRYIDDFLDDTGWRPILTTAVPGALQYREYDIVTRLLIRLLMRREGHPTDASHDYDFTDWDAVDAFADQVQVLAPAGPLQQHQPQEVQA